jgi:hypothetical protein
MLYRITDERPIHFGLGFETTTRSRFVAVLHWLFGFKVRQRQVACPDPWTCRVDHAREEAWT